MDMSEFEAFESPMTPESIMARAKVLAREHRMMRAGLVECRREAGLSQRDVAERMGVSQQAVSKFEHYDSDPKLSTVRRYANAVGVMISHHIERDHGQAEIVANAVPAQGYLRAVAADHFVS